jgi:phosphoesterase RecJ-like protein
MLEKYSFLPRAELLTKPPATPVHVDVAIALDTAIQNRLGTALAAIGSAKIWINIDHHLSNPGYGDLVIVDVSAPATGEIIFNLIKSRPAIQPHCRKPLRCVSTDTGSFQYPKTSARTFEIGAELVGVGGLDAGKISQQL